MRSAISIQFQVRHSQGSLKPKCTAAELHRLLHVRLPASRNIVLLTCKWEVNVSVMPGVLPLSCIASSMSVDLRCRAAGCSTHGVK